VVVFVRGTNDVGDDVGLQELGDAVGCSVGAAVDGDAEGTAEGEDVGTWDNVGEAVGNLVEAFMTSRSIQMVRAISH
jgi:hypothetical protein